MIVERETAYREKYDIEKRYPAYHLDLGTEGYFVYRCPPSEDSGKSSIETWNTSKYGDGTDDDDEEYFTPKMVAGKYNESFVTGRYLGGGTFGKVFTAVDRFSVKLEAVVKILPKDEEGEKEGKLLRRFQHENIVKCLDVFSNDTHIQIVMQKHGNTCLSLDTYLCNIPPVNEQFASFLFMQLVNAVEYLHSMEIAHLDIKEENVIINEKLELQLIDFGLSEDLAESCGPMRGMCGSVDHMPPEMFIGRRSFFGKPADIWALGVTFFFAFTGNPPFPLNEEGDKVIIPKDGKFVATRKLSSELKSLFEDMFEVRVWSRANINDVKNHVWFAGDVDFEKAQVAGSFTA